MIRRLFRYINKLDNVVLVIMLLPALSAVVKAGVGAYQGRNTPEYFHGSALDFAFYTAQEVIGNYTPIIEGTGNVMAATVNKAVQAGGNCLSSGGAGGPIYLNQPATAPGLNLCDMGQSAFPRPRISPAPM
jgi:hypothetical protein